MEQWTVDKIIAGLKCIIHEENMPVISEETLRRYRTIQTSHKTELEKMLKLILAKEEKILGMYGTTEEIAGDLKTLEKIPEMIKYSKNDLTELCEEFIHNASGMKLVDSNQVGFYSKQDVALFFFKRSMRHFVVEKQVLEYAILFYNAWFLSYFNKIREDFEDCYEFVSESTWKAIQSDIDSMLLIRNPKNQNRTVTYEMFTKLRAVFPSGYDSLLEVPLQNLKVLMKEDPIKKNKEFYNHIYSCIEVMIIETEKIYLRYKEVFRPFARFEHISDFQMPAVRSFQIYNHQFYLAEELEAALELALKRRNPNDSLPKGLVRVENESDQKQGKIFSVSNNKLQEILKKLELNESDLNICKFPMFRDYQWSFHPIISSYATHCKPALHVLDSVIYYITVVLKYLESSEKQRTKKLRAWMSKFESLFTQEDNLYFIESWRINRLFDQARKEFNIPSDEKLYQVKKKNYYTNEEVLHEVLALGKHIPLEADTIIDSLLQMTLDNPNKNYTTTKDVYCCYSRAVKIYMLSKSKKMTNFVDNQVAHMKTTRTVEETSEEKGENSEDDIEKPTNDEKEEPIEDEEEKLTEGEKEEPTEDEEEEPTEDKIEKPTEDEEENPTEDEKEEPTEDKIEKPTEDEIEKPRQPQNPQESLSQYFREYISVVLVLILLVIILYIDPKRIWKLFTFLEL